MALFIVALLGLMAVAVLLMARGALTAYAPAAVEPLTPRGEAAAEAPAQLDVVTWNVGYAGLGAGADFIADGGRRWRPGSRDEVAANLAAIENQLQDLAADVFLLQELAGPGPLTRGVDVLSGVRGALSTGQNVFTPTVQTGRLPGLGVIRVGKGTFSRWGMEDIRRHALPTKADVLGLTVQHYNFLVHRLPVAGADWQWVILNIHLAAFDDGDLRRAQLQAVVDYMAEQYRAGNRVVAGGDWNMLLAHTAFPHTTAEKDKFWVRPLPAGVVPDDWQWVADAAVPTCRTLERPYRPGENYTCVIDGFLVTPNVQVEMVQGRDLGFAHTDHHPVRARFTAR